MNSERYILKRLLEGKVDYEDSIEELDEKTYTVGDSQYWKRGGKCYKWTQSGGKSECSEDEYYKAISGEENPVKNTSPENDKARTTNDTTASLNTEENKKKAYDYLKYKLGNGETGVSVDSIEAGKDGKVKVEYSVDVSIPYQDPETGSTSYETDTEYRTYEADPKDLGIGTKSTPKKEPSNPNIVKDISRTYGVDPSDITEVYVGDDGYEYIYKGDETKSLGFYNNKTGTLSNGIDPKEIGTEESEPEKLLKRYEDMTAEMSRTKYLGHHNDHDIAKSIRSKASRDLKKLGYKVEKDKATGKFTLVEIPKKSHPLATYEGLEELQDKLYKRVEDYDEGVRDKDEVLDYLNTSYEQIKDARDSVDAGSDWYEMLGDVQHEIWSNLRRIGGKTDKREPTSTGYRS